jgi:hypothetical protein
MTQPEAEFERLAELGRATDSLEPSAGFTDAVMLAVEHEEARVQAASAHSDGLQSAVRDGRAAVIIAAMAAAACLWLSFQAERSLDEEVLATVDVVEVAE